MEKVVERKNSWRTTSIIVGVLILAAYSVIGSGNPDARVIGMLLEAFSGLAVIAIGVLMFQVLSMFDKKLSFWYMVLRLIEGGLLVVTGLLFLSQNTTLFNIYSGIHASHGYIFAAAALIFNYLLYKTKLVPRWLSVFGIVATTLLLVDNVLEATGMVSESMILKLPVFLSEIVLALWLIFKGFDQSALDGFQA